MSTGSVKTIPHLYEIPFKNELSDLPCSLQIKSNWGRMKATLLRKIKEINDLLLLLSSSSYVHFGVPAKTCSPVNKNV